jgi:hypothetical protein
MTARFESEPPGAEARTSVGQACRTPCALAVPAQQFSVTFSLAGYLPQTVPVQVQAPDFRTDSEFEQQADFRPNPVVAELELAPPPPPPPRKKRPRKKKPPATARAPARAPAARPAPAPAAPPPQTFTPSAPPAASPWPATR